MIKGGKLASFSLPADAAFRLRSSSSLRDQPPLAFGDRLVEAQPWGALHAAAAAIIETRAPFFGLLDAYRLEALRALVR